MGKFINSLKWSSLVAATLMTIACDRQTDPMKDYPELAHDVPLTQAKANDQSYDGVLFDIRVQGKEDDSRTLDFYEGKETSFTILARSFVPGLEFQLKAHNLPKGASLGATARKDTFVIKWTPARETLPKGLTSQQTKVQVEFVIDQNSSAKARQMFEQDKRNRVKTFTFVLSLPDAEPSIRVVGLDKPEYKRGEVIPFSVEVTDLNSSKSRKPDVVITFRRSETKEAKTFPVVALEDYDKGARFEGGKWIVPFNLDTTMIHPRFFDPKSGYESGEFLVHVVNPSSNKSAQFKKLVKVIDQSQAVQAQQAAPQGEKK